MSYLYISNAKGSTDYSERIIKKKKIIKKSLFLFSAILNLFPFSSPFAQILMIWFSFLNEAISPQPYTCRCNFAIFIACLKGRSHISSLECEVLLKIIVSIEQLLKEENTDKNYAMRVLCVATNLTDNSAILYYLNKRKFVTKNKKQKKLYEAGCSPLQLDISLDRKINSTFMY